MKLRTTPLLAFAVLTGVILLIASCKKDSSPGSSTSGMSATIGDSTFASTVTQLSYDTVHHVDYVGGLSHDSSILQLTISRPPQVNVPVSSDMAVAILLYYNRSNQTTYVGGDPFGKAVYEITLLDSVHRKISGTFSGTLFNSASGASPTDSLVITNGKFNFGF